MINKLLFTVIFCLSIGELKAQTVSVCISDTVLSTLVADILPGFSPGLWTSSNASVAAVGSTGLVTGVGLGTAVITYSYSGILGTLVLTVDVNVIGAPSPGVISGSSVICIGSPVTLGETVTGGTWSAANANATVGVLTGTVTGVTVGTDVVSYAVGNICGTNYATYPVTVNTTPVAGTISGANTVCTAAMVTLGETVTGGTWSAANANAAIGSGTGIVTGTTAGMDNISYTITNTCGTSYATYPVTVNTTPAAGTISGTNTVCTAATVTLGETATGGTWSAANTNAAIGSGTGIVTGTTAGTDNISYAVTNTCGTSYATYPVTVNTLPAAGTISGTNTVCTAAAVTLGETVTGGTWSAANPNAAIGSSTGTVTGVTTGTDTISYAVTNVCGTSYISYTVTVNTIPDAGTISGTNTVCTAAMVTLGETVTGGTWSAANANAAIGSSTGNVTGVTTGTDTISYAVTNVCGTSYTSYTMTVNTLPAAGTISGTNTVCIAATVTLGETVTEGTWSAANANAAIGSGTGSVTGTTAGTDNISYAVTNTCGTSYTTYPVTVNTIPAAGTISGTNTVCTAATVTLGETVTGGTWSAANANATIGSSTGTVTGVTTGTDTISYAVTNVCGTSYTSYTVTVNTLPPAGTISGTNTLCTAATVTLGETVTGGTWSSANANAAIGNSTGTVTGVTTGTDTISYAVTNICGTSYTSYTVTVNTIPTAGIISGTNTVCTAATVTLGETVTSGTWSAANPNAAIGSSTGIVTGVTTGTDTISYAVTNVCGTSYTSYTVTVNTIPAAGTISGTDTVCTAATVTLVETVTGGTWSAANVNAAIGSGTGIVTGTSAGTDNISYAVTNTCGTSYATYPVTVNTIPAAGTISGTNTVCTSATTTLRETITGGMWSAANANATIGSVTGTVTGVTGGTDIISYALTNTCGTNYATYPVTINTAPVANTISGATTVFAGSSSVTLGETVSGGVWSVTYGYVSIGSINGVVTGNSVGNDIIVYTIVNACGTRRTRFNITSLGLVGNIYTIAGLGTQGNTGDGGLAVLARLVLPRDLALDSSGNLYICEPNSNLIRKIANSGIISTICGNTGTSGNNGDNGPASAATLYGANGLFADNSGNLLICNTFSNTIRKINASGIITTICGTGINSYSGDGGPASAAQINNPLGICEDTSGNIYISDDLNNRIRKIDLYGTITTVVGTGANGYSGDGGPATNATLNYARGIRMDGSGNLYITDVSNQAIRRYATSTGIITTIAGIGDSTGLSGDGGAATTALLNTPVKVAFDGADILYICDQSNNKVRQVRLSTGIISTIAGNGTAGFSGDKGLSTAAEISNPAGIACDKHGNLYVADAFNNRIRLVIVPGSIAISGPAMVCTGAVATYTAATCYPGTAVLQWQKNGVNVATGTAYTDSLPDSGAIYTCIATVTPPSGITYTLSSNSITLSVSSCSGRSMPESVAAGLPKTDGISIVPNPNNGFLTLLATFAGQTANTLATASVTDITGKTVYTGQFAVKKGITSMNISLGNDVANGLYLVRVKTDTESFVSRFIVQR